MTTVKNAKGLAPVKGQTALLAKAKAAGIAVAKAENTVTLASVVLGERVTAMIDGGMVGQGKWFGGMEAVASYLTTEVQSTYPGKTFSRPYILTAVAAYAATVKGVEPAKANQIVTLGYNSDVAKAVKADDAKAADIVKAIDTAKAVKAKAKATRGAGKDGKAPAKAGKAPRSFAAKAKATVAVIDDCQSWAAKCSDTDRKAMLTSVTALLGILRDAENAAKAKATAKAPGLPKAKATA